MIAFQKRRRMPVSLVITPFHPELQGISSDLALFICWDLDAAGLWTFHSPGRRAILGLEAQRNPDFGGLMKKGRGETRGLGTGDQGWTRGRRGLEGPGRGVGAWFRVGEGLDQSALRHQTVGSAERKRVFSPRER